MSAYMSAPMPGQLPPSGAAHGHATVYTSWPNCITNVYHGCAESNHVQVKCPKNSIFSFIRRAKLQFRDNIYLYVVYALHGLVLWTPSGVLRARHTVIAVPLVFIDKEY